MSATKKVLPLTQICVRHFSKGVANQSKQVTEVPSPAFKTLKEKQKKFQIDNGVPVYLKGGLFDRLLFQATCALTAVGLAMTVQTWYVLIKK